MGFHLPFFPLYAAETLADGRFQQWNLEERGAWITLLAHNWNDLDIPEGHTALARLLRVETGDMARIWSAIGDRFSPAPGKPGRLVCPRLEDERDKALALSRIRADAGVKGAKARWNKGNTGDGKRMRLPKQTHGKANADAMRSECPQPSPSPSQPPSPSPSPSSNQPAIGGQAGDEVDGFRLKLSTALRRDPPLDYGRDRDGVERFFREQLAAVGPEALVVECCDLAAQSKTGPPGTLAWFIGWLQRLPTPNHREANA